MSLAPRWSVAFGVYALGAANSPMFDEDAAARRAYLRSFAEGAVFDPASEKASAEHYRRHGRG